MTEKRKSFNEGYQPPGLGGFQTSNKVERGYPPRPIQTINSFPPSG